jgi:hypothetical protein
MGSSVAAKESNTIRISIYFTSHTLDYSIYQPRPKKSVTMAFIKILAPFIAALAATASANTVRCFCQENRHQPTLIIHGKLTICSSIPIIDNLDCSTFDPVPGVCFTLPDMMKVGAVQLSGEDAPVTCNLFRKAAGRVY